MKTFLVIVGLIVVILGGGFAYLSTTKIPAPTTHVEKSLDDHISK
jgi:hypothetical protein